MRLYRITKELYLKVFNGRGASFQNGARWNQGGFPVLYFAPNVGTALLEMANYLPSPRFIPPNYYLGIYEIDDQVSTKTLKVADLPSDWANYPYPSSTQKIGSQWLESLESLILYVPSTAVSKGLENIAVINPLHPEIDKLVLISSTTDLFNSRTFKGIN